MTKQNNSKLIKETTINGLLAELWFNDKTKKFDIWYNHKKVQHYETKGFVLYEDAENNAKTQFENWLCTLETFELPDKEHMTIHQRMLRKLICDYRNELIGGQENHYLDTPEAQYNEECDAKQYTKQWAIDTIYYWIMDDRTKSKYLYGMNCDVILEKKHIRFMGERFIRALIEDRVEADYRKNGWAFPNNYEGK